LAIHDRQWASPVGQAILPAAAFQAALEAEQIADRNSSALRLPAIAQRSPRNSTRIEQAGEKPAAA
jgi:hypothetical protein